MKLNLSKRGFSTILFSVALVLLLCSAGMGVAAAEPVVSIEPSDTTVNVGDDFEIYVQVNPDGNDLQMAKTDLTFDSSVASLTVANGGMFTTLFNAGTQSGDTVDDIVGLGSGVSTTGNLAILQMHADSAGTFTLDLSDVTLGTADGTITPTVTDGTVTIEAVNGDEDEPTVSVTPSTSNVCVGDDFEIYVQVNPDGNDLQMARTDLTFDSSVASLTVADGGMFTTMFNAGTQSGDTVDDIVGLGPGVSTTGNLAVLQMHADSAGTFTLDLSDVTLGTADGTITPTVNDGTVTIEVCGPTDGPTVSIEPSDNTVNVGDDFEVYIQVNPDGNDLQMARTDLTFDSSVASLTVADGGMFTTLFNAGTQSGDTVDDIVGLGPGVSTTGNLAVLQMHADSAGTFALDLSDVTLGTADGTITPTVIDGTVTIKEPISATRDIMPEPAEVGPCDEFNVSITVQNDGSNVNVVETIPEGFEVVSSTLGVPNPPEGNEVTFILGGETSFEYTVSAANEEGTYTFDGVVVDTEENEYPVGGETTIDVVLPEGIAIQPGWNFMSVPFELNNSSVGSVLADVNYDALVYYNASSGTWDTVTEFEPLKGYWIKSSEECTQVIAEDMLEPEVPSVPATMTVYEGWNAIGYTDSMDILSAELVLGSIDDSYTTVKGPYNPATMSYEQVGHNGETGVISGIHVGTDVYDMGPYEGHWVYVTEETTLSGF